MHGQRTDRTEKRPLRSHNTAMMNEFTPRPRLSRLLGGALVAALLATSLPGAALADADQARGRGHRAAAETAAQSGSAQGEASHGQASLSRRHGFSGELTKIEGSKLESLKLTLVSKDGERTLLVTTTDETEFRAGGHQEVALADLKVGQRLNVQGTPVDGAAQPTLEARRIRLVPAKEGRDDRGERVVATGVVSVSTDGKSLTVTPAGGTAVTFAVTSETRVSLEGVVSLAGQTAKVTGVKDATGTIVALKVRVPAE
jgi:hypothetical protein